MFNPKAIFFDLDGTLIDSLPDLAEAVDQMMLAMDKPTPGIELIGQWVGNGADRLIKRALTSSVNGEPNDIEFQRAKAIFLECYSENLAVHSKLYEGVSSTLEYLRQNNVPLICITNKPSQFTLPLLENFGIAEYFICCISGDSLSNKKPHPEPLLYAAEYCRNPIAKCLMVGDSKNDIQAAKAAGCPSIAVSYGYNHGADIRQQDATEVIDLFPELLGLLDLEKPKISV